MKNKKREKIYLIGHKIPDTDTIVSAIGYAEFLKKTGKEAIACRSGNLNPETKFVLDYFKVKMPKLLSSACGKKIILLDHNEKDQSLDDIDKAEILEIIDHHKVNFQYSEPIFFLTEPIGSTSTLVARRYFEKNKKIDPKIAGILLSGILSDTVIFRSPTTTKEDVKIAEKLAKIAKIKNLKDFGIEIKKKKSTLQNLSSQEIIYSDFKVYEFSGKKVGMGQIEIFDEKEFKIRKKELLDKLKEIALKEKYALIVLMVTNIIKTGSEILFFGEKKYLEITFKKKVKDNSFYLKGVVSRKKQILPCLMKAF